MLTASLTVGGEPAPDTAAKHDVDINFPGNELGQILEYYGMLTGRTVLEPKLPYVKLTVRGSGLTKDEGVALLDKSFKEHHFIAIPDGEKFVRIVPEEKEESDTARAAKLKSAPPKFPQSKAGTNDAASVDVSFPKTDLQEVADFYSALVGATGTKRDAAYAQADRHEIFLKSVKPLTPAETLYALDTVFAWEGFEVLPSTNNLVRLAAIR